MRIDEKVALLHKPGVYPGEVRQVEVIETHFSWVFLTERNVYKLKKPVRYHGLDFTTLAARRHNCEQEVMLNRRLAPDVYLGAVALTSTDHSEFELDGRGPVVDWLVVMRRLPAERMLDAAIRAGTVRVDEVRKFSLLLADFYRRAAPVILDPEAYRQHFATAVQANHVELTAPAYGLPGEQIAALTRSQEHFLRDQGHLLARRAHAGRVVDAHGDLRPEHICLTPDPVIIDCLEFDAALRRLDPVDELAYLALECERLGAPAVGTDVLRHYREATGDDCPDALIHFYTVFRACLRAKIAIWHLADCAPAERDHWSERARSYLDLAASYADRW
jgi:aminoglycoside phosphotransferase family enzyme